MKSKTGNVTWISKDQGLRLPTRSRRSKPKLGSLGGFLAPRGKGRDGRELPRKLQLLHVAGWTSRHCLHFQGPKVSSAQVAAPQKRTSGMGPLGPVTRTTIPAPGRRWKRQRAEAQAAGTQPGSAQAREAMPVGSWSPEAGPAHIWSGNGSELHAFAQSSQPSESQPASVSMFSRERRSLKPRSAKGRTSG